MAQDKDNKKGSIQAQHKASLKKHNDLCEEYARLKPNEPRKAEIEKIWSDEEKFREGLVSELNQD